MLVFLDVKFGVFGRCPCGGKIPNFCERLISSFLKDAAGIKLFYKIPGVETWRLTHPETDLSYLISSLGVLARISSG